MWFQALPPFLSWWSEITTWLRMNRKVCRLPLASPACDTWAAWTSPWACDKPWVTQEKHEEPRLSSAGDSQTWNSCPAQHDSLVCYMSWCVHTSLRSLRLRKWWEGTEGWMVQTCAETSGIGPRRKAGEKVWGRQGEASTQGVSVTALYSKKRQSDAGRTT